MMIQHGGAWSPTTPDIVSPPAILGVASPSATIKLPEHSSLIHVYQNPTTYETAFHPVQAHQHCHRYMLK